MLAKLRWPSWHTFNGCSDISVQTKVVDWPDLNFNSLSHPTDRQVRHRHQKTHRVAGGEVLPFRAGVCCISRSCGGRRWWGLRFVCQTTATLSLIVPSHVKTTVILNCQFRKDRFFPGSDCLYSPSCRGDLIICHLSGSEHLSVHARPQRQNLRGDRPSFDPHQRPHGPSRIFHPRRRLMANKPAGLVIYSFV